LLVIKNLSIGFREKPGDPITDVVDNISFSIKKGETVGLVGESGCGKSVTALSIVKLLPVDCSVITHGSIEYEGQDISKLPVDRLRAIRGKKIGFIFQDPMSSLTPLIPIGNQLIEALSIHDKKTPVKILKEKALETLNKVGIPRPIERFKSYPHELSGGMRQRIVIAMAIINNPDLIIADEPTTALDVTIQAQILDLLMKLKDEYGCSMLLISHNLAIIKGTCDKVLVMYAGRVAEESPSNELYSKPLHPYTKALIGAIPVIGKKSERLFNIEGQVPPPSGYNSGCRFYGRCSESIPVCKGDNQPKFFTTSNGHFVSCHLYN